MRRKHTAVVAAAKAFAKNSNPRDQLFVISFSANWNGLCRPLPPVARPPYTTHSRLA